MFVVCGLVLGSLVGFVTSLFRARNMKAMLAASNVASAALSILFFIAILLMKSNGQGGDTGMAYGTMVALGLAAYLGFLGIGAIGGLFLHFVNGEGFFKNSRSTIIDVALLLLVFLVGQGIVVNTFASAERANMKRYESEMRTRIERLNSQIPLQYQGMNAQSLRDSMKRPRATPVPEDILNKVSERELLQSKLVNDYGLAQFSRNNERRANIFWSSVAGWLISIFVVPILILPKEPSSKGIAVKESGSSDFQQVQ